MKFWIKIYVALSVWLFVTVSAYAQTGKEAFNSGNLIVAAVAEYNEGKYPEAVLMLKELTSKDPSNDAAWYYLAMCSLAKKDLETAEEYLDHAVSLDPRNFWYRYRLAGLYAMTSRPELTVDLYEKLLSDFPKKSELYFDMVELYSAQGENEKALDTLEEIETVFGMTESIAVFRFNLLMRMQKQQEAYSSLEEYNSKYSSPYVLATLADYQLSMYNDSTAIAYYDEALDIAPDYAPALLGKAEAFRMTRKYDRYFEALGDFVANPSDVARSKTDYLMAVVQRMDPKFLRSFMPQMDAVIEKTLEVHPADSGAIRLAGSYYYSTDRKDKAKGYFRRNMDANPGSLMANVDFVEYLMFAQEWEDLSVEGRKAFERFPQETAFLEMASMGDYNLERFDKVLEICDKVLEVAPTDSSRTLRAWSTKGDIYHQLGDSRKSYKAYEKALKINPGYVYVLNNYAYYLSMEGRKLKKAYAMSKKTIDAEPDNATYLDTFGWILYLQGKPAEAKPFFKHAMLYGGKDSVVIMDHYAEVLYALGEYDRAFVYWNNALKKNDGEIPGLDEKIKLRKQEMKKKTDRK